MWSFKLFKNKILGDYFRVNKIYFYTFCFGICIADKESSIGIALNMIWHWHVIMMQDQF